jgi:protein phosphatase PTC2/3
MHGQPGMGISS